VSGIDPVRSLTFETLTYHFGPENTVEFAEIDGQNSGYALREGRAFPVTITQRHILILSAAEGFRVARECLIGAVWCGGLCAASGMALLAASTQATASVAGSFAIAGVLGLGLGGGLLLACAVFAGRI
jgi:hypothetical protein